MNGALARRARRRAISVLPTPVGPIMRMFLGVISARSGSGTCERRQRLRNAIATARFACAWPTMYLSSSWTISCGVIIAAGSGALAGDRERFLHDVGGLERRIVHEGEGGRLRVAAPAADGEQAAFGLEHVAGAGDEERSLAVGDGEH